MLRLGPNIDSMAVAPFPQCSSVQILQILTPSKPNPPVLPWHPPTRTRSPTPHPVSCPSMIGPSLRPTQPKPEAETSPRHPALTTITDTQLAEAPSTSTAQGTNPTLAPTAPKVPHWPLKWEIPHYQECNATGADDVGGWQNHPGTHLPHPTTDPGRSRTVRQNHSKITPRWPLGSCLSPADACLTRCGLEST